MNTHSQDTHTVKRFFEGAEQRRAVEERDYNVLIIEARHWCMAENTWHDDTEHQQLCGL